MVVTGLVVTLQPSMTVQEEVKLGGVADASVHHSSRQAVATPVLVVLISWVESCVMVFAGYDVCDGWAVPFLQLKAGGTQSSILLLAHLFRTEAQQKIEG